jgi:hypothetical protein
LPRLSILILTLKSRESMFDRLLSVLGPQCEGLPVEIIVEKDDGESCIGDKRNRCLDRATGDYIAFIDDDDLVHDEYVELILNGIETGADCIGFKSLISNTGDSTMNGSGKTTATPTGSSGIADPRINAR